MGQTQISVMNTLDKFGEREMSLLIELLNAYNHANSFHKGKQYAALPDTWNDDGVHVDYDEYSSSVFLVNSENQTLVNTDYGIGMRYSTPFTEHSGTLFDLADEVNDALTNEHGDVIPFSDSGWHIDDLNYMWHCFEEDAYSFLYTGADLSPVYTAQDNILKAIALNALDTLPVELKDAPDHVLVRAALIAFEWDITYTETYEQLADFIRAELEKRFVE